MKKNLLLLAVLFLGCIGFAQVDSELDQSFDHKDHMDLSRGNVRKLKVLPNGKILVLNTSQKERFAYGTNFGPKVNMYRLNSDLTYDDSFSPISISTSSSTDSNDFDVFSDNKILIAGWYKTAENVPYYLARFNEDGTPDDTFSFTNRQGLTAFNVTTVASVKILPNDQILIGGAFTLDRFTFRASGLAKLNYDGTVDMSFAGDVISQTYGYVGGIDYDSEGNVIIVGSTNNGESFPVFNFIQKRNPNGGAIAAFNATNEQQTGVAETLNAQYSKVKVSNDKIYAWINAKTLNRYLLNGTIDPAFTPIDKVRDFQILSNGNILVSNYDTKNLQVYDSLGVLLYQNAIEENLEPFICVERSNGSILTQLIRRNIDFFSHAQPLRIVQYNADLTLDIAIDKTAFFKSYKVLKTANNNLMILGHRKNLGLMKHHNGVKYVDYNGNLILTSPFTQWSNAALNEPFSDLNYYNNGLVLPNGKIVLSYRFLNGAGQNYGEMVRLNSDFTYDMTYTTYGGNDKTMAFHSSTNKLVIGGGTLERYDINGVFDNEFYQNHFQLINNVKELHVVADDKIVLAELGGLMRVNENGTIDNTFAGGLYGFYSIDTFDITENGEIIFGGQLENGGGRAKRKLDGTLDASYATEVLPANIKKIKSIKLFADGSAIGIYDSNATKSEIIKFDANGNLAAFNMGTGFNGIIHSFEVFEDSKIMVSGDFNQYNGTYVNGVARLNGVETELGIVELVKEAGIVTLYPNPTNATLNIQSNEIVQKIEIYSLDGKLVQKLVAPAQSIDVSTLESGYYFCKVYSQSGNVTKKFVKQ